MMPDVAFAHYSKHRNILKLPYSLSISCPVDYVFWVAVEKWPRSIVLICSCAYDVRDPTIWAEIMFNGSATIVMHRDAPCDAKGMLVNQMGTICNGELAKV